MLISLFFSFSFYIYCSFRVVD